MLLHIKARVAGVTLFLSSSSSLWKVIAGIPGNSWGIYWQSKYVIDAANKVQDLHQLAYCRLSQPIPGRDLANVTAASAPWRGHAYLLLMHRQHLNHHKGEHCLVRPAANHLEGTTAYAAKAFCISAGVLMHCEALWP